MKTCFAGKGKPMFILDDTMVTATSTNVKETGI